MNLVSELRDIIVSAPELDEYIGNKDAIASGNFPADIIQRNLDLAIQITEVSNVATGFAGDHAQRIRQRVNLRMWYPKNFDYTTFDWKLNRVLEDHGFYWISGGQHEVDEQTYSFKMSVQYIRTKQM